jgi:hypothetical protein
MSTRKNPVKLEAVSPTRPGRTIECAEELVFLMMKFTQGNLLDAPTEALVNTVNTVGVMGKGNQ